MNNGQGGKKLFHEARIFERFLAKLSVKFFVPETVTEGFAYTHDISAKGLGLVTQEALAPKSVLELWINLPEEESPFYVKGEVAWSRQIGPNVWRVGINLEHADFIEVIDEKFSQYKDRRDFYRFVIRLPVKLYEPGRKIAGYAYTHDVSAKGLGLITKEEFKPNTLLQLWISLPNDDKALFIKGEVIWSKQVDLYSWRIGINLAQPDLIGMSRIFQLA